MGVTAIGVPRNGFTDRLFVKSVAVKMQVSSEFPLPPSYPSPSFIIEKPNEEKHPRQIHGTGGIILKVREIIKIIEADGWYLVATKGSHRQFKHHQKSGRITIAGHLADDLAPGTMNSIFKQAQLKE
jgi:predicted RNA binding protein YcfA (HicA-like mRNA interferase family)